MENTIIGKLIAKCPCGKKQPPDTRHVLVGGQPPPGQDAFVPEKYPSNRIVSSKYTAWNFIFLNLFEQFHRIANFYFLIVAIIQFVIDTPVSPVTSLMPLIFVVLVTAIKQGYEDWLRHKADKEVNNRPTIVIRDGKLETINAAEIEVGDIVKVTMNGSIPCDLVMMSSHDTNGECYITTANLDGETNLKTFQCVPATRYLQTEDDFNSFRATIECQQPQPDLYSFYGNIHIHSDGGVLSDTQPLSAPNVLLRGSRLKNTPFVYGCAIYTGNETKISLNSKSGAHKFSRVEKKMNDYLITFLIVLIVYSAIWTGLKVWFYNMPEHAQAIMWYTPVDNEVTAASVVEDFLAFMVLCNYVIPISMYVTIELQKFFGSMFFEWDAEMYDAQANEPAKANTSDLNEELGQVEYLFTDKTGTLTENDMQFRQCSVGGTKYEEVGGMLCYRPDIPGVQPSPVPSLTDDLTQMLTVLALCHTVRVDRKDNLATGGYSENGFEYEYQASSPDEKALVEACRRYGIVYHGVRDDRMEVTFQGRMRRYIQHHVLEFDPTRKRMSVIVQDEDGNVFLLVKGAETALLNLIVDGDEHDAEKHVDDYAMLGLRTLVIAQKKLTEEEFSKFDMMLKEAKKALDNRVQMLKDSYEAIERNLTLLGVTAVEDRLQDGVPETISALREAGIQIWVLTGDKEETAVNVSYSAGHFQQGMIELRLTRLKDSESCAAVLEETWNVLEDYRRLSEKKHCLIVDGVSLTFLLDEHRDKFRQLCQNVVTVLCCRMTPIQKAEVVNLMKTSKGNPTTAAIGDGANDVSMIKEAHVGLGIMGKEGRQAVRASDYAFGRFRFLKRALLVHGHYFYVRIAILVQYFFYKNVAMITAQLYFTFISAFSEQSVYDSFFLTFFNITFTALPILVYGLFEMHCQQSTLEQVPALYKTIRRNSRLSISQFLAWNALGLYHSVILFFGVYLAFYMENTPAQDGEEYGVYEFGAIIMTTCVIVTNVKLGLVTYHFNGVVFFGFALTAVGYFALVFVYSEVVWSLFTDEYPFLRSFRKILSSPMVWLLMCGLSVAALLPDLVIRASTDTFSPMYRHEKQAKKRFRRRRSSESRQTLLTSGPVEEDAPRIFSLSHASTAFCNIRYIYTDTEEESSSGVT